jgi:hypothetical protein
MSHAFAVVVDRDDETTHRPVGPAPVARAAAQDAPTALAATADDAIPDDLPAALLGLLHEQRDAAAARIEPALRRAGVDATVCAFVRDDVAQASQGLADLAAWLHESLEALARPTPSVLLERAADASVLAQVEDLQLTLAHLRRRLVQVAAGVRRADAPRAI